LSIAILRHLLSQIVQLHIIMARCRELLRERLPDVYAALFAADVSEATLRSQMPDSLVDRTAWPGDGRLTALMTRRSTLDWVLRRAVSVEPRVMDPISPVFAKAGLHNSLRRLVVDGAPVATGLTALGDSVCTTNPTLGRGLSLALWEAADLVDALEEHAHDWTSQTEQTQEPDARVWGARALAPGSTSERSDWRTISRTPS
jgi:hypothetical protein